MTLVNRGVAAFRRPLLAVITMLVAFGLLVAAAQPPTPAPENAPPGQFSAGRAAQTLRRLVGDSRGHPTGTAQNAAVRQRLTSELSDLGLAVETQAAFSCLPHWAVCAVVTNVMARWPGVHDGPAVLLTAHYDSVAAGPGAGDDLAGVAALLEVARILAAEPPLASPVILLFTDGEEIGLLGAHAFVSSHPWAQDVGVVVNLEANGTSGQSLLFETTHHSGWLAQTLAGAETRLVGNAFADSLYAFFPFNTDLTVYQEAGIPGVNFAFVDGHAQYHTPLDTPQNVDSGSLQHHGDNALAAARAFGAQDLRSPPAGEDVYADLAPGLFVSWPVSWTLGLALALAVGWLAVTATAVRQGSVTLRQVLWGLLLTPVAVVAATLAGLAVGLVAAWSSGAPVPWYAHPTLLRIVIWVVALLIVASAASLLWPRAGERGLFYGAWAIWALLGVAVAALWPPASFMVLAPVLVALVLAALLLIPALRRAPGAFPVVVCVGLFSAGWMWLWFARGSDFAALTPEFAPTAAFAIALTATTGAALLAVPVPASQIAIWLSAGLAAVAAAALVIGAVNPVYSATSPQPLNVLRIEDTQAGRVAWALDADGRVPASLLAARPFGLEPVVALPWQGRSLFIAPGGEPLPLTGPAREVRRIAGEPLSLTLPAGPAGSHVAVYLPRQAGVQSLGLRPQAGQPQELAAPPPEAGYHRFLCVAPACDGATLEIDMSNDEPITAYVVQTTAGLPADDQDLLAARPDTATPRHGGDATLVVDRLLVITE